MKISKHTLVSLVIGILLLASPFLVHLTTSLGEYDPWLDTDDSGVIDMRDIGALARAFSTMGDPAKNVTIARRANKLAYSIGSLSLVNGDNFLTPAISVDGYSKMTITIATTAVGNAYGLYNGNFTLEWNTAYANGVLMDVQHDIDRTFCKTYDVPNQVIQIIFWNNDQAYRLVSIDVYLIP